MNERIKELAKEAGIVTVPNSRPISIMGLTTDLEKFAELLIRECCDIVHEKTDESIRVVMAIETRFGIE